MRHRERLVPPVWLFAVCLLVVPSAVLVFLPIDPVWGWVVAIGLYLGIAIMLLVASPAVEVDASTLRAGRARIPLAALGTPVAHDVAGSRTLMRTGYDAAAYHCTVPWVRTLVHVPVDDADDPTSAWVVASRRPDELAAAIAAARA